MEKISFKNLSAWLKTLVICGWVFIGFTIFLFLIGFVIGIIEQLII